MDSIVLEGGLYPTEERVESCAGNVDYAVPNMVHLLVNVEDRVVVHDIAICNA